VKILIRITKKEMQTLTKKYGVRYGYNGIFRTASNHRKSYYLTESPKNMKYLKEIQNSGQK